VFQVNLLIKTNATCVLCRLAVRSCTSSTCICWAAITSGCCVRASTCTHLLWWLCLLRSSICTGTTFWAGVSYKLFFCLSLNLSSCVSLIPYFLPYWTQLMFEEKKVVQQYLDIIYSCNMIAATFSKSAAMWRP